MLAICTKDGLTLGSKLYRNGEVFVLTGTLGEEYEGLSDERFIKKQKKVYKEVLFRRPTPDEIKVAIADKKVTELTIKKHFDKRQLKTAMEYLRSKHLKQARAAEAFIDKVEIEIHEDAEEEKMEVEKAPEEAPEEEEKEEAPKEEKVEAPVEEEKAPEEEKTEGEEAPDKTDTPPEEPVKEAPKKKDKGKGKN